MWYQPGSADLFSYVSSWASSERHCRASSNYHLQTRGGVGTKSYSKDISGKTGGGARGLVREAWEVPVPAASQRHSTRRS